MEDFDIEIIDVSEDEVCEAEETGETDNVFAEDISEELSTDSDEELQDLNEESAEQIEDIWDDKEKLEELRETLTELQEVQEEESDIKVLTREITPEILESRERDTEETLENYRDNLRDRGIEDGEMLENFISGEREKINMEYASLDRGDKSPYIYYMPTEWEGIANSMRTENMDTDDEMMDKEVDELEEAVEIDYEAILQEIREDSLNYAFEGIDIEQDKERLEESLGNFNSEVWDELELDDKKASMSELADYIIETVGFDNPPQIEYYNNERLGDYGGYNPATNTLRVNEYMLYESEEAADTIAHELWHAHQRECAENPQSALDYQYQYNLDNYITPELGQDAYRDQLIEREARAFAERFKERI